MSHYYNFRFGISITKLRGIFIFISTLIILTPYFVDAQSEILRKIAFSGWKDGDYELFIVNEDGTNLLQLTDNPWDDTMPTWSPNGEELVFQANRAGYNQLYLINISQVNQPTLIQARPSRSPTWSPLGDKIAFYSSAEGTLDDDIYVMDIDGSNLTNLTNTPNSQDQLPSWSNDGLQIAFRSTREREPFVRGQDPSYDEYIMNSDGTNQHKLFTGGFELSRISWSPDNSHIAYHLDTDSYRVFIAEGDGTNATLLNIGNQHAVNPSWSMDNKLALAMSQAAGNEIAIVNPDGSNLIFLTNSDGDNRYPEWQPIQQTNPTTTPTAKATDTPIPSETATSGSFPTIGVLDNFNGADGAVGSSRDITAWPYYANGGYVGLWNRV